MASNPSNTEPPQDLGGSSQDQLQQGGGGGSGGGGGGGSGGGGGGGNFGDSKRGRGNRGFRGGNRRSGFFQNRNNGDQFRGGIGSRRQDGWKDHRPNGEMMDGEEGHSRFPPIDKVGEKLAAISGPTFDLPPLEVATDKKFCGRTRLYVGNVSQEVTENDLKELFEKFGETGEFFMNKEKNFAFLKMDYVTSAEKAKRELDGYMLKGKNLKIRFAPSNSVIKVKNLSNFVSNELLHHGFSVFGEIEKALVLVDERGKPTGEGIVEFARKGCALHAIRKCTEKCFFLTGSLRPVVVEPYEHVNDTDGYPEKFQQKRNPEYMKERQVGPRFAENNSFEEEYGERWKQLIELYRQKGESLKKELQMEMDKLEAQMEFAKYEHETAMLRDQLRARELDRDRQKQEWEMKERLVEEQRRRNEEEMRRKEESLQQRLIQQEEEMRRRKQENNLFMQAHQLNSMLDQQEQSYEQQGFEQEPEVQTNNWANNTNKFGGGGGSGVGGGGGGGRGGAWLKDRRDDFQPKRRRF